MTLDKFRALSERDQTAAVYAAGTFMARRWQEADEAVFLYQMSGGFFVGLTYLLDLRAYWSTTTSSASFSGATAKGYALPRSTKVYTLPTVRATGWVKSGAWVPLVRMASRL